MTAPPHKYELREMTFISGPISLKHIFLIKYDEIVSWRSLHLLLIGIKAIVGLERALNNYRGIKRKHKERSYVS